MHLTCCQIIINICYISVRYVYSYVHYEISFRLNKNEIMLFAGRKTEIIRKKSFWWIKYFRPRAANIASFLIYMELHFMLSENRVSRWEEGNKRRRRGQRMTKVTCFFLSQNPFLCIHTYMDTPGDCGIGKVTIRREEEEAGRVTGYGCG